MSSPYLYQLLDVASELLYCLPVADFPIATCGTCLAFTREPKGPQGELLGRCRFRPELKVIGFELTICSKFAVKPKFEGKVLVPKAKKVHKSPRSRAVADDAPVVVRKTLERPVKGETSGEIDMDRDGLKQVLRELLEEETLYGYVEMGKKWQGGTLVLKPADESLQSKEIPIDTFFHKIVMLRDRLRVLEAKVNGNDKLDAQEKVELQQYVSKIYGTLTTFNVLFQNKSDQFTSK